MAKKKNNSTAKKVLVGAGLAAGAALAAYLLTSPKDRKKAAIKIKSWMNEMQKETAEKVKKAQGLTQEKYNQIVDEVKPKYEVLKDVSATELSSFADELKSHWKNISSAAKKISAGKKK
ncbi:hypothetical protein KKB43_03530 [Patescibacteria group bacterium]|nr:hypothetical protein [Patescibacteria group bacterium]MBU4142223.1 hypothetical protein [Patescibacteria group bacterium]MBU4338299.1 hypothetical protein [Patescibacteria group bacterium]MBU4580062.1 hypothetical protein [Patescibacteria group bacterium]